MAESASYYKTALAHELKNSVKGEAKHRIKSVFVTKPKAYDIMWEKLECHYGDPTASVQAALEDLQRLKPVKEEDYKALVELVDDVESAYSQLEELNQLNTLTMRDVDNLTDLLPTHLKVDWRRKDRDLSSAEKLQPFTPLMNFLDRERSVVARLAENQHSKKRGNDNVRGYSKTYHVERGAKHGQRTYYKCAFPTHRKDTINHTTEQCKDFQKLSISGKNGRYELLKQINACFKCFGNHRKLNCPKKLPCSSCGSDQHHSLLCIPPKLPKDSGEKSKTGDDGNKEVTSYTVGSDSMALYPIHQATISDSGRKVSVFCDGGFNASFITHRAAERIKAKKVKKLSLDVTTMGNVEKTYNTWQYEFPINTSAGKKVTITAFGMERITGQVSKLDPKVLVKLFLEHDPETLQRKSTHVDVLLGCDNFGLHPKQEEARCGDNLTIMNGALGICLQGAHPDLIEETRYDINLAKRTHDVNVKVETYKTRLDSHPEFNPNHTRECSVNVSSSYSHRKNESQIDNFIQGEELATQISPQCGGCRCHKCPTVGHTYSFKEEQELKLIQENLECDEVNQCWITSYPWLVDPQSLPNNYHTALATLERTERTLKKDDQWAKTYKSQMDDMVDRPAISTEAVYKTAELYQEDSPQAANLLKHSSYVDDLIDSRLSKPDALTIAKEAEDILAKGGFVVKCWQFSGETQPRVKEELLKLDLPEKSVESSDQGLIMLKGTDENLRVLGLGWNPKKDTITYEVTLNFSSKRHGVRTGPNLLENDLPSALPNVLTRRIVLEQRLCLERCLRPVNSNGRPWLIILSDGSDLAYGFAAYIRWKLDDGSYWCRLIMTKCRIAPINKLSTPQMELNAAVLSKRGRKVIEKEMRFDFERVLQIVDSETVLSMIHKTSTRFKVYEGVRIGEIQAATEGDLTCWAWMSGQHNTTDWLTRGRAPEELNNDSHWWNGPPILYRPIEEWGLKFNPKKEPLPGEKKAHVVAAASVEALLIDYKRFSNINKAIWIVARFESSPNHLKGNYGVS
ncbi:Hypothetical predicted protein [Paramuricea clavata]|uniref:Uncharacterized protein n=1 Tax=Paramuricea clavata TaxID=317549 RepID=A0A7D9HG01_PARCT|nr:Hypothetical predicted protein [Paramuricea clavata]